MRQMIYVSAAAWKLGAEDISAILRSARRHNPAQNVTGMLLYIDLGFLQFLEGPPAGVQQIYARIRTDKRHTGLRVLLDEEVDGRLFSQWSMGFGRPDPTLASEADIFTATRDSIETKVPLEKALVAARLVRTFYSVNAGMTAV